MQVIFPGRKCTESKTILYEVSSGKATDLLVKKGHASRTRGNLEHESKTMELEPNENMD